MTQLETPDNCYVDIPDVPASDTSEGSYKNVATFHSYTEAVAFATAAFGADEEGRIHLITGGSVPDKSYRVTWEPAPAPLEAPSEPVPAATVLPNAADAGSL